MLETKGPDSSLPGHRSLGEGWLEGSFISLYIYIGSLHADSALNLSVAHAQKTEKVKILLAVVGHSDAATHESAPLIKKALEFNNQCEIFIQFIPDIMSKKEALQQGKNGFNYIILCVDSIKITRI